METIKVPAKDTTSGLASSGRERGGFVAMALAIAVAALVAGCGGGSGGGAGADTVAASDCQALASLSLPGAAINAAEPVAAGSYTPPGTTTALNDLPAFCRVAATLKPTPDSNIRIEMWMPLQGWNGRFLGTGNGGGAGGIRHTALAHGLKQGFATANTDLGTSPNAEAVVGHPERWVDFGGRANHEMTTASKALVRAHYSQPARRSYFLGCSTGGQQALSLAQRYPDDYDGIIAGAPANNRTHVHAGFLWNHRALQQPGAALSTGKIALVTKAVVDSCAGKDGGAPGDDFLTDPRRCTFNPDTLPKCQPGADNDSCVTDAQVSALKAVYSGPANPRTGERIYTGIPVGSETNALGGLAYQSSAVQLAPVANYPFKWVFGASYDTTTFDFDRDMDSVDARLAPIVNANSADLSSLKRRGGKVLMYGGTSDPLVPYQDALNYYERVAQAQGGLAQTQEFFRYFVAPGMGHCGNFGTGVTDFGVNGFYAPASAQPVGLGSERNILAALVKWVEEGAAPDQIVATAFKGAVAANGVRFQRPLCPYPQMPSYVSGDVNAAASYRCELRERGGVDVPAARYLN